MRAEQNDAVLKTKVIVYLPLFKALEHTDACSANDERRKSPTKLDQYVWTF